MDNVDNTIIKLISDQVNKIRENGFEPLFIILNEAGYRALIQYIGVSIPLEKLNSMTVLLDPGSEVYVKVLCDPTMEFRHLGEIRK